MPAFNGGTIWFSRLMKSTARSRLNVVGGERTHKEDGSSGSRVGDVTV